MDVHLLSKLQDPEGLRGLHLKLVGKVALITGIAAAVLLLILVLFVSEDNGTSYREIIQAYSITRAHLPSVMALAALLLIMIVGLSVGLIALYSSFRIAGPLYRFSRNLQGAVAMTQPTGIRKDDALHALAGELHEGVNSLEHHYDLLRTQVEAAQNLAGQSPIDPVRLSEVISELKAIEVSVRLDG
jgi:hypothetical protein